MKTFVKALLFAFWLLGAGGGLSIRGNEPAEDSGGYRYTVVEGIDLSVQHHRIVLRVGEGARGRSLSVAAPHWVAAFADRPASALTAASTSAPSHDVPPCLAHSHPLSQ